MNFDMNTLSALMQFMSAQKPQPTRNEDERDNSDYPPEPQNNASVFAMQNGLGQRVDFEEKPKKQRQSQTNPMSSLLNMMTGGKAEAMGGGDMSSLMPMLLNMMSGKNNKPAQAASAPQEKSDDKVEKKSETKADKNEKTQSVARDKYEPIAFAGYALISALNKLYISKRQSRMSF